MVQAGHLIERLIRKGYTLGRIAAMAGVSLTTVSAWNQGRRQPVRARLEKLARLAETAPSLRYEPPKISGKRGLRKKPDGVV